MQNANVNSNGLRFLMALMEKKSLIRNSCRVEEFGGKSIENPVQKSVRWSWPVNRLKHSTPLGNSSGKVKDDCFSLTNYIKKKNEERNRMVKCMNGKEIRTMKEWKNNKEKKESRKMNRVGMEMRWIIFQLFTYHLKSCFPIVGTLEKCGKFCNRSRQTVKYSIAVTDDAKEVVS